MKSLKAKAAGLVTQAAFKNHPDNKVHSTKRSTKWKRILTVFFEGQSLHRFEAERLGDHALHSTVSTLQSKGVVIHRRDEVVPGYQGAPTHVCRYWLAPESHQYAAILLGKASTQPEEVE